MRKSIIISLALLTCTSLALSAQNKTGKVYPKTMEMKPEMTEIWEPQPKVVTPGDQATGSAPSDAIVLFDGKDLSMWERTDGTAPRWTVHDGVITVVKGDAGDIQTKERFGSFQLHLEWQTPVNVQGSSQSRGNSGVFLQGKYEVQILDNYENETYIQGMVGSLYKQTAPLVNPMRKPGEWNVYDIIYTAPVFREDGQYLYRPHVTVILNGVVVQSNTEIFGTTEYIGLPKVAPHGDGPIILQAHGDPSAPLSFRNIWIRKM